MDFTVLFAPLQCLDIQGVSEDLSDLQITTQQEKATQQSVTS